MNVVVKNNKTLHDRYPELGRADLPVFPYTSPEYYAREKEHVFKKTWLHVGRVEEIPGAGDYFVKDLECIDSSIVVVRTKSGEVRAFHNVCAHRLNRICYESRGKVRKFFCKFHGWSYDLDGKLTGVPDEPCFFDFDRKDYGMTPVNVGVWQGFIFINVDPNPKLTLDEFLKPMFGGIEGYPFDKMTNCFSWVAEVRCNWKMALDAFQEAYHVAYVHGRSIADALEKDENGNLHPIDGLCGDFHRRVSMAGNTKSVYGNPKALTEKEAAKETNSGDRPIAAAALRHGRGNAKFEVAMDQLPGGLNWTRHPNWAFDFNVIFPDFYLSLRPNYFQAYNFRPIGHNRTLYEARVYYPEMKNAGGRFYQEYMKTALRDVLLEDMSTLEFTQAASETIGKSKMVLQDYEIMIRHNCHVVDRMIAEGEAAKNGKGN